MLTSTTTWKARVRKEEKDAAGQHTVYYDVVESSHLNVLRTTLDYLESRGWTVVEIWTGPEGELV